MRNRFQINYDIVYHITMEYSKNIAYTKSISSNLLGEWKYMIMFFISYDDISVEWPYYIPCLPVKPVIYVILISLIKSNLKFNVKAKILHCSQKMNLVFFLRWMQYFLPKGDILI